MAKNKNTWSDKEVGDKLLQVVKEEQQSKIPQLPTRLDLFTAAALTGLMSHPASIPPTNLKSLNIVEYCQAAREIGKALLYVCDGTESPPQSKP